MKKAPEYTDGCLELFRIENDKESDFPVEILKKTEMTIWFREISVYDKIRYEFEQAGKEITMKIRIPRFKGIDSECACEIEGKIHLVYNAAHITDKDGFKETELTLIRPDKELRIE